MTRLRVVACLLGLFVFLQAPFSGQGAVGPSVAHGHLATFGSWEITRAYLGEIFPEATNFLRRKERLTRAQVKEIEGELGFELNPEDWEPEFYIAVDESGGERRLLGVAVFVDPRVEARHLGGGVVRIEVGIGVDSAGRIARVRLFEYRGSRALTEDAFLRQLEGRRLGDSFAVGPDEEIKPVEDEPLESQLVANAAHEALYLMKVALGR